MSDRTIVCAVHPEWIERHGPALAAAVIAFDAVHDGAALNAVLARDWSVDLVVLDLALATRELVLRLGVAGPRLLAFGDPANAGLALSANLIDFIDETPAAADLLAAIAAAAVGPPRAGLADLSDRTSSRLGALGAEAERVAAALARLSSPSAPRDAPPPIDPGTVRGVIRARNARERYFPAEIFGDPAWDMLLDLTAARIEGRDVSVSSLCIAARVPTTTALRWIRTLCDAGLFARTNDPADARRAFIALAEPAAAAMAAYLAVFARPGS